MPISEWLGPQTPWFARMTQMIDFIWENHCAGESFQRQPIVQADPDPNSTANVEVHGEMLQVLPRLYWGKLATRNTSSGRPDSAIIIYWAIDIRRATSRTSASATMGAKSSRA